MSVEKKDERWEYLFVFGGFVTALSMIVYFLFQRLLWLAAILIVIVMMIGRIAIKPQKERITSPSMRERLKEIYENANKSYSNRQSMILGSILFIFE